MLTSPALHAAFLAVRREHFLPDLFVADVYRDVAHVTCTDDSGVPLSSSSQPTMMAMMLRQLDVSPGHRVLEVGTGTGYNAGLLAHLVGPTGQVVSLDIDPELVARADANLRRAGVDRVDLRAVDGWAGAADAAPFDRVMATVGVPDISPAWVEQLRPGGRLVVPLTLRPGLPQISVAFVRDGDALRGDGVTPCGFIELRGDRGLPARDPRRGEVMAELLATAPRSMPAPPRVDGWFDYLVLDDRRAMSTSLPGRHRRLSGLLDTAAAALALVDDDEVLAYGGDGAALALHAHLSSGRGLDVARLSIVASPAASAPPPARWLLRRPSYNFGCSPA